LQGLVGAKTPLESARQFDSAGKIHSDTHIDMDPHRRRHDEMTADESERLQIQGKVRNARRSTVDTYSSIIRLACVE
jgi:hypothetical protein